MDATVAFNPNTSFLTVIMALLGGATSAWGPMLGVVSLVLISDYLSITVPNYFSVVLGLVLLAIVFLVPDGLIGLAAPARLSAGRERLAQLLRGLARRIDPRAAKLPSAPALSLSPEAPSLPSGAKSLCSAGAGTASADAHPTADADGEPAQPEFGGPAALAERFLRGRARAYFRPDRPQRLGQDHAPQYRLWPARADPG